MFLAIDIGNTNVTLGVYESGTPGPRWRLATGRGTPPDEYAAMLSSLFRRAKIDAGAIRAAAISSVVPSLTGTFAEACRLLFGCTPFVVDGSCRTGLRICYDDPGQLGADRIVDAAAAYALYGGPACVIDFGTATTFDGVSAAGEYLGGAIAPGIGIASQALFEHAAKLPKVELQWPPVAIGRNTVQSLQSGLMYGYIGLVEGIVGRFRRELGPETRVIATGGLAEIIARKTGVITILAPWLTLDGLRVLYELNKTLPA